MPGARAAVDVARVSGQVVFLSDTPMPGWFLRELLERSGLWQEGDRVYCSADRVSKTHGGGLYDVAARDLGIATAQIRHTGDNLFSDVAEARLRGVVATTTAAGRLNRYESILEREAVVSDHLASHLAGASRLARLRAGAEGIEPVLAAVAAGVSAVARGLRRLARAAGRAARPASYALRGA